MLAQAGTGGHGSSETARYFSALREHPLLIAGVLLLAVAAALVTAARRPDTYEARTDVLVSPVSDENDDLAGIGLLTDPASAVFAAARLVEIPQTTSEVLERLDLNLGRKELLDKVTVTPLPQSNSFSILAKGESPDQAAEMANTFAEVVIDNRSAVFQRRLRGVIERLERRKDALRGADAAAAARDIDSRIGYLEGFSGGGDPTLEILTAAVPPDVPATKSKLSIVVAFVAALLLGTGLALLLELLSPRIRGHYDLPVHVPLLARIPFTSDRAARRLFSDGGPAPPAPMEPYRMLRAKLAAGEQAGDVPIRVLVTSPSTGDGKTRTAAGLAAAIAAGGRRVILVDADLRGSGTAALFGVRPAEEGLVSLLEGDAIDLERALVPAGERWPGLRILFPGRDPSRGLDLLEPGRVEAALAELGGEADVLVVDSPPLTEFGDAITLAGAVGVVLLTVRLGHTREDRLQEALQVLQRIGVPPFGLVVSQRRGSAATRPPRRGRRTAAASTRPEPEPATRVSAMSPRPTAGTARKSPARTTRWTG
jgi:polysaccharide biosynthesis transport protein